MLYGGPDDMLFLNEAAGDAFGVGNDLTNFLYGNSGANLLIGHGGADSILGGEGHDELHGDSGEGDYDLLDGGSGDDTYWVDTGNDLTFEAIDGGIDTVVADVGGVNNGVYLYANVENLILAGTTIFGAGIELDNELRGNSDANWLLSGAGSDTLIGEAGSDILFGQAGADRFVFASGSGSDLIGDFEPGTDRIDLSAFGYDWAGI